MVVRLLVDCLWFFFPAQPGLIFAGSPPSWVSPFCAVVVILVLPSIVSCFSFVFSFLVDTSFRVLCASLLIINFLAPPTSPLPFLPSFSLLVNEGGNNLPFDNGDFLPLFFSRLRKSPLSLPMLLSSASLFCFSFSKLHARSCAARLFVVPGIGGESRCCFASGNRKLCLGGGVGQRLDTKQGARRRRVLPAEQEQNRTDRIRSCHIKSGLAWTPQTCTQTTPRRPELLAH